MVILEGHVIDAKKSTSTHTVYIQGGVLSQGSGWGLVSTDSSGHFYTSANTNVNSITMKTSGFSEIVISVSVFSTHYDGRVVISGALTANADATTYSGKSILTDTGKLFMPGSLYGRTLTMQDGVCDGYEGIIENNTVNTIKVGGGWVVVSGAPAAGIVMIGGINTPNNVIANSTTYGDSWSATTISSSLVWNRDDAAAVVLSGGVIAVMGGLKATDMEPVPTNEIWTIDTLASNWVWTCVTSNAPWSPRFGHTAVKTSGLCVTIIGGCGVEEHDTCDVWRTTDGCSSWVCLTALLRFVGIRV